MKNVFDDIDKDFADFDEKLAQSSRQFSRRTRQLEIFAIIYLSFVVLLAFVGMASVTVPLIIGPERFGHMVGSITGAFSHGFHSGMKGQ